MKFKLLKHAEDSRKTARGGQRRWHLETMRWDGVGWCLCIAGLRQGCSGCQFVLDPKMFRQRLFFCGTKRWDRHLNSWRHSLHCLSQCGQYKQLAHLHATLETHYHSITVIRCNVKISRKCTCDPHCFRKQWRNEGKITFFMEHSAREWAKAAKVDTRRGDLCETEYEDKIHQNNIKTTLKQQ